LTGSDLKLYTTIHTPVGKREGRRSILFCSIVQKSEGRRKEIRGDVAASSVKAIYVSMQMIMKALYC